MTEAEIEAFVREQWLAGATARSICMGAGITDYAVNRIRSRLDLPERAPGAAALHVPLRAALRTLWMQDNPQLSVRAIGVELGLTKSQVVGQVHRMGLPERPSPIKRNDGQPVRKAAVRAVNVDSAAAVRRAQERMEQARLAEQAAAARRAAAEAARLEQEAAERLARQEFERRDAAKRAARPQRHCQWLFGDPRALKFCAEPAVEGRPYCAEHTERAYVRRPVLQSAHNFP